MYTLNWSVIKTYRSYNFFKWAENFQLSMMLYRTFLRILQIMKVYARLKFILLTFMFSATECSQELKFSKTTNSIQDSDFDKIKVNEL